jgi:hypothetical protein
LGGVGHLPSPPFGLGGERPESWKVLTQARGV